MVGMSARSVRVVGVSARGMGVVGVSARGVLECWERVRGVLLLHALMQSCYRLVSHLEKWLNPLAGCIHFATSCLLVLIGTSCVASCVQIEANVCIYDLSGETIGLYRHKFVQQAKKSTTNIKRKNDKSNMVVGHAFK